MNLRPFSHHSKCFGRQMSFQYFTCLNINSSHILTIKGMDMRRIMFCLLKIHTDNDPLKSGQYRH